MFDLQMTHISLLDVYCAMMLWSKSTLHILHPRVHHESNLALKSASLNLDIYLCKHTHQSIKEGSLFVTQGSSKLWKVISQFLRFKHIVQELLNNDRLAIEIVINQKRKKEIEVHFHDHA
jgi:hypothetical protein